MKILRTSAFVVALAGLSGCLGYEAAIEQYDPGYSEQKLAENSYLIRYSGPGMTPKSTLEQFLRRRAAELCAGAFTVGPVEFKEVTVMERFEPQYRYVEARVVCTRP